jgi:hypothetical protein
MFFSIDREAAWSFDLTLSMQVIRSKNLAGSGNAVRPQGRSRGCPRNCKRRALLNSPLGEIFVREGRAGRRPASQETDLRRSPFPRTGRAHGAVDPQR